MKLKVEFNVDNAAYQTPDGPLCGFRIGETLRKVAWEIENSSEVQSGLGGTIFDDNGNTVGKYILAPSAEELRQGQYIGENEPQREIEL